MQITLVGWEIALIAGPMIASVISLGLTYRRFRNEELKRKQLELQIAQLMKNDVESQKLIHIATSAETERYGYSKHIAHIRNSSTFLLIFVSFTLAFVVSEISFSLKYANQVETFQDRNETLNSRLKDAEDENKNLKLQLEDAERRLLEYKYRYERMEEILDAKTCQDVTNLFPESYGEFSSVALDFTTSLVRNCTDYNYRYWDGREDLRCELIIEDGKMFLIGKDRLQLPMFEFRDKGLRCKTSTRQNSNPYWREMFNFKPWPRLESEMKNDSQQ